MASSHALASQDAVFSQLISCLSGLDTRFERARVWGPQQVFATVFMLKSPVESLCYDTAIPRVRLLAGTVFGWTRDPDAAGLSRMRRRCAPTDAARVWTSVLGWAQRHAPPVGSRLPGKTVVAIDGTTLHVPRSQSLMKAFGLTKNRFGIELGHYPQAQVVSGWDLDRRIPVAWTLTARRIGERQALLGMLDELPAESVLVMDRGFPARDTLGGILASGRHAIVRMVATHRASWPEVAAFLASGKTSDLVTITVRQGRRLVPTPVRLILRTFRRGRPHLGQQRGAMVVMSTLIDPAITDAQILSLYHERWGIETIHREMKSIAQVERWHGTTKALIQQELTALMCWFTIAGAIATRAEADAAAQDHANADSRPPRRVNTKRVFEAVNAILVWQYAALSAQDQITEYLHDLARAALHRMSKHMQRRRPGRWLPRVPKHPYARRIA
jgi:hypothetical protein